MKIANLTFHTFNAQTDVLLQRLKNGETKNVRKGAASVVNKANQKDQSALACKY